MSLLLFYCSNLIYNTHGCLFTNCTYFSNKTETKLQYILNDTMCEEYEEK